MTNIPDGFKFNYAKLLKGGGIEISYDKASKDGSITNVDTVKVTSPQQPHPDLSSKIESLDSYLADTFGLLTYKRILENVEGPTKKEEDGINSIKRLLDNIEDKIISDIDVVEVSVTGIEGSRSVTIKGKQETDYAKNNLNSVSINLQKNKFGWEEDLSARIDSIAEECCLYLFDNKKAQGDLFAEENGKHQEEPKESKEVAA